jgi:hypothetical protein
MRGRGRMRTLIGKATLNAEDAAAEGGDGAVDASPEELPIRILHMTLLVMASPRARKKALGTRARVPWEPRRSNPLSRPNLLAMMRESIGVGSGGLGGPLLHL